MISASYARKISIDASLEEIEKIEVEIEKACKEGKSQVVVTVPFCKHDAIEASLKEDGYEIEASWGNEEIATISICWF